MGKQIDVLGGISSSASHRKRARELRKLAILELSRRGKGDDGKAIDLLGSMISSSQLKPDERGRLLVTRAHLLDRAGRWCEARTDFKEAIKLLPGNSNDLRKRLIELMPSSGNNKNVALIIGIGEYRFQSKLDNPENDAKDVAELFAGAGYEIIGYPEVHFTKKALDCVIREFAVAAKGAKKAVVWFAGHGYKFESKKESHQLLLPIEYPIDALNRDAAVSLESLTASLKNTGAELTVLFIDACRNLPTPGAGKRDVDLSTKVRNSVRSLVAVPADEKIHYTILSASTGQRAADRPNKGDGKELLNSPFAAAFLETYGQNANVSLGDLFVSLREKTKAATGNGQEPSVRQPESSDIELPYKLNLAPEG